jgi:hypothetical protein
MNYQSKSSKLRSIHWFFFLLLAIAFAAVGVQGLRQNNQRMAELFDEVRVADETGEGISPALNNLGEYVFTHMNTSTEITLASQYSRDAQVAIRSAQPEGTSDEVYDQAITECENPNIPLTARANCVAEYVSANSSDPETTPIEDIIPPKAPYTYSFVAPLWSADLAGLSLLASSVLIGLGVASWLKVN